MAEEAKGLSTIENESEPSARLKLKGDQEKALVAQIIESYQLADSARTRWMADKEEGLQLYWGIRKAKDFPFKNCANLHVPLIRTISDTLHSNIMGSIDTIKPASITPIGPEDVPKSRKIEKLLNWQFSSQVDYTDIVDKVAQSTLIYGVAPVKVRYVVEKSGNRKTYDGLKVDILAPERFLYPPDAPDSDVDAMEFVMQEVPLTISGVNKRIAAGMYDKLDKDELDKLGDQIAQTTRSGDDFLENIRSLYSGLASDEGGSSTSKRYVTVLEWYGNFDHNDDGIDEPVMVSMVKETQKILRVVKWEKADGSPRRRPFVLIKFSDILNRASGESVPDLLRRVNQELNTIHNQRVDAVTLSNVPFFFFDPVSGFNPDEVRLTPGLGIPVNGSPSQAVYFPALQTVRPETYREEEALFEYAERMLGAGANVQGVMNSKRVTATEIAAVDRRSGIRFLTIFNRIRKGIREMFKLALELDREYMPAEIQVRITGIDASQPVFETMSKQDLEAQVDILINGNSILDEQADKSEAMQAYQIGTTNPLVMRDEVALYELTRDTMISLGIKKVDSYLRKPADQLPKMPAEEHNLFMQEEYIEPHVGENVEEHLRDHAALINSDNFKLLTPKAKTNLMRHLQSTLRMKAALDQLALIQKAAAVNGQLASLHGIPGAPPMPGMPQPGMQMQQPQQGAMPNAA